MKNFEPPLKHWQTHNDDGVLHLILNRAEARANSLNPEVLREFSRLMDAIAGGAWRALVLRSGKASGFIAGADLDSIRDQSDETALLTLLEEVHAIFDRFAALPFLKIAVINGFCLGGGLELALCCDVRLGTRDAVLGFPEVKLGLHPGFGGTVRLTRRLPAYQALPLMLTGRSLKARAALKLGLLDAVYSDEAQALAAVAKVAPRPVSPWVALCNLKPIRMLLAKKIAQKTAAQANFAHYPALPAMITLWRDYGGDAAAMAAAERASFAHLRTTPTCAALLRLYFLQNRLKGLGKNEAPRCRHLHVIGAGVMGGDIAAWAALSGIYTTLSDCDPQALARAQSRAHDLFARKARDEDQRTEATMRLRLDPESWGLDKADVIVEAVAENLELKQKIWQEVVAKARPDALLTTNTSSLELAEIARVLPVPSRLLGLHFFNPVAKMMLVEVVTPKDAAAADFERAARLATTLKKLPLPVAPSPGFLVNRILLPYLFEALLCADEGIALEIIDQAATDFGMPIGPIELADTVGLDVCAAVAASLAQWLPQQHNKTLQALLDAGHLGRKTGQGFYRYHRGKAQKKALPVEAATLRSVQKRLVLSYLNACAWCLRQGVVSDADLLDAACVFATGFAPHRGGPLYYAQQLGFAEVASELEALAAHWGARFAPDAWWHTH